MRGNHTIKIGADIREYRWSASTFGNSAGTYTFNSNWTAGPLNNAAPAPGPFWAKRLSFSIPEPKTRITCAWNFGIQRQLPGQMVLEVVYIGNHGVHLPVTIQLDYIPRQYLSASPFRDQTTINLLSGSVANPFKGLLPNSSSLNGSTVLRQLLIPFPHYHTWAVRSTCSSIRAAEAKVIARLQTPIPRFFDWLRGSDSSQLSQIVLVERMELPRDLRDVEVFPG